MASRSVMARAWCIIVGAGDTKIGITVMDVIWMFDVDEIQCVFDGVIVLEMRWMADGMA